MNYKNKKKNSSGIGGLRLEDAIAQLERTINEQNQLEVSDDKDSFEDERLQELLSTNYVKSEQDTPKEFGIDDVEELPPLEPQKGTQEFALNIDADVIFYGGAAGSAKTFTILMRFLLYKHDPNFQAIYFRRSLNLLAGAGGLFPEALSMWKRFGIKSRGGNDMRIRFPEGSLALFSHLNHEDDKDNHLGLQYSAIFFDELPSFTETQFNFMLGRLRSRAKNNSFVFATMNPDYDSWVYNWVEWYLYHEGPYDGRPDPAKSGTIRYFVTDRGKPVFADTREQLEKEYPHLCWVENPKTGKLVHTPPKSFVFIAANIFDNEALITSNPGYLSSLQALEPILRERMLYGNWKARPKGSTLFSRDWLKPAEYVPDGCIHCRAWDKASSVPSEKEWFPDYTAGSPMISKTQDGYYYLTWGFHEDIKDPETQVTGRFRMSPGDRDRLILKQALYDGTDVAVVLPKDSGSAGVSEFESASAKLVPHGITVIEDRAAPNQSKTKRFEAFASACQNGLVYIVESSFPNKATLEEYLKELEAIGPDHKRSTRSKKDDWFDATASAFNKIREVRHFKDDVDYSQFTIESVTNKYLEMGIYNNDDR